tara:strand:- start:1542 stop:1727 length:186 start_codon:yes stop_codon:yes gene_type:complete
MKIKLLTEMIIDGHEVPAGEIVEINESSSYKWIKNKWGEPVIKEKKIVKETKELKVSKETK